MLEDIGRDWSSVYLWYVALKWIAVKGNENGREGKKVSVRF